MSNEFQRALDEADEMSIECLEAAADTLDRLIDGTFYQQEEDAVLWLRNRRHK